LTLGATNDVATVVDVRIITYQSASNTSTTRKRANPGQHRADSLACAACLYLEAYGLSMGSTSYKSHVTSGLHELPAGEWKFNGSDFPRRIDLEKNNMS
jgi:hypothetical protein